MTFTHWALIFFLNDIFEVEKSRRELKTSKAFPYKEVFELCPLFDESLIKQPVFYTLLNEKNGELKTIFMSIHYQFLRSVETL